MKYMRPYIHTNKYKNRPNQQNKLTEKNRQSLKKLCDFLEALSEHLVFNSQKGGKDTFSPLVFM